MRTHLLHPDAASKDEALARLASRLPAARWSLARGSDAPPLRSHEGTMAKADISRSYWPEVIDRGKQRTAAASLYLRLLAGVGVAAGRSWRTGTNDERGRYLKGMPGSPGRPLGWRNKPGEDFFADMHGAWLERGRGVIYRLIAERPEIFLMAMLKITQVHRVQVGQPEQFDRPSSKEEALRKARGQGRAKCWRIFWPKSRSSSGVNGRMIGPRRGGVDRPAQVGARLDGPGQHNPQSPSYILIPGAGGMAWYWHRVVGLLKQAQRLSAKRFAVDLPGDDESAGLHDYAEIVVREIGQRINLILVAQSLGAFTAAVVCERASVGKLIFVNPPLPGETAGAWWENTGAARARLAAAEAAGYSTEFDLQTYFLHDLPKPVLQAGPAYQREEAENHFQTALQVSSLASDTDACHLVSG